MSRPAATSMLVAIAALAGAPALALAQPTQVVEDKDMGVRFVIANDWTWEKRDRGSYQKPDIVVNCAPKVDTGRHLPACRIFVDKSKAPAGQTAITDAERAKWAGWAHAGMRTIVSKRDLKLGGYPAYEVVARAGKSITSPLSSRVFILIPGLGVIDATLVAEWNDKDQHERFAPAFRAALDSIKSVK